MKQGKSLGLELLAREKAYREGREDGARYGKTPRAAHASEVRTTILGFASLDDGRFELIIRDEESMEETTLKGQLEKGQFETVDKILPTCVFVKSRATDDYERGYQDGLSEVERKAHKEGYSAGLADANRFRTPSTEGKE